MNHKIISFFAALLFMFYVGVHFVFLFRFDMAIRIIETIFIRAPFLSLWVTPLTIYVLANLQFLSIEVMYLKYVLAGFLDHAEL